MSDNQNEPIQDDPMKKLHYTLILIFSLFAGFLGGVIANRLPELSNKILLSGGLGLSFLGVLLMIVSKIYKAKDGRKYNSHVPLKHWMYNCGWIALILGLILQTLGIWFS